ncbi:hypothetical protein [Actinomadura formosensis]|uniref:hypothetical protein n=1 Tax=Actinomadura formosensis TaxID=60706 RepID=UPI003D919A9F
MPAERQFRTAVRAELDVTCLAALTVPGMARMLVGLRLTEWGLDALVPDPRALEPGHGDAGGRGLPIVAALASECRVSRTAPHGKWVWARVRTGK